MSATEYRRDETVSLKKQLYFIFCAKSKGEPDMSDQKIIRGNNTEIDKNEYVYPTFITQAITQINGRGDGRVPLVNDWNVRYNKHFVEVNKK